MTRLVLDWQSSPFVMGTDLRGEVRGPRGQCIGKRAGKWFLDIHPELLMIVECYSSANDLVDGDYAFIVLDRLVYSDM